MQVPVEQQKGNTNPNDVIHAQTPPPAPNPEQQPPAHPSETPEERAHRLELENAKLQGILEASKSKSEPEPPPEEEWKDPEETNWEKTKVTVNNHISALDDDKFEESYKMTKEQARQQMIQGDNQLSTRKNNERFAKSEAENELLMEFGEDYKQNRKEILKAIRDAAPEVKQNANRLTSYLKRHLKAELASKPKPASKPQGDDPMNRRIVNDFVEPNPTPTYNRDPKAGKKSEMSDEHRKICGHFGIVDEDERKKYLNSNIEVKYGGGVVFRDPSKGFEKSGS